MSSAFWALAAAVALVWPAALAGPLDGAPFDTPAEVVLIGAVLPLLILASPRVLAARHMRMLTVALLAWKALTAAMLTPDGWCVRFESPVPIFRDDVTVPHSWDIRADWHAAVPRCSAIMVRPYDRAEAFPTWFFNLAPAEPGRAAGDGDRPPNITTAIAIDGYLSAAEAGTLRIQMGEDVVATVVRVDATGYDKAAAEAGIKVGPGRHRVTLTGELVGSRWSLKPDWNGSSVWRSALATVRPPRTLDAIARPWGRWIPMLLVLGMVGAATRTLRTWWTAWPSALVAGMSAAVGFAAASGREAWARVSVVVLGAAAVVPLPRRWRSAGGAWWLIVAPVVVLFSALAWSGAGRFTLYSSGDDWWMFQRFAYRIYLQGHWIEGGERTFWFQPGYRYLAGALHIVFGDSSVGELLWDGFCAGIGAMFAFRAARHAAGARGAMAAALLTLLVLLLGPAWYLFGRGLSELTSMGCLYAAAICALRARGGSGPAVLAAGLLAALAFLARLNNLPAALGLVLFALPSSIAASDIWRPRTWIHRVHRPTVAAILGGLAAAMWALTARTYYFTHVPSMLYGTQAGLLATWHVRDPLWTNLQNVTGSILMVLTMSDPPGWDPRALPVLGGAVISVATLIGFPLLRRLSAGLTLFYLAALSGAVVARGSAYPGRFSVHLVPAGVAISVAALGLVWRAWRLRTAGGGEP